MTEGPVTAVFSCVCDQLAPDEWAVGLALRAWDCWCTRHLPAGPPPVVADVGGVPARLTPRLLGRGPLEVLTIDPVVNCSVEAFVQQHPTAQCHAVFALGVIEHVKQPVPFLRALAHLVAPGGLCFLTADYWDCEGPDLAEFKPLRERIYHRASWEETYKAARTFGLHRFGLADWHYHGPQIAQTYSLVSLAMVKE